MSFFCQDFSMASYCINDEIQITECSRHAGPYLPLPVLLSFAPYAPTTLALFPAWEHNAQTLFSSDFLMLSFLPSFWKVPCSILQMGDSSYCKSQLNFHLCPCLSKKCPTSHIPLSNPWVISITTPHFVILYILL